MNEPTHMGAVILHYTEEDRQAALALLQWLADEYQRDAIASAQSEMAMEANRKEYSK